MGANQQEFKEIGGCSAEKDTIMNAGTRFPDYMLQGLDSQSLWYFSGFKSLRQFKEGFVSPTLSGRVQATVGSLKGGCSEVTHHSGARRSLL